MRHVLLQTFRLLPQRRFPFNMTVLTPQHFESSQNTRLPEEKRKGKRRYIILVIILLRVLISDHIYMAASRLSCCLETLRPRLQKEQPQRLHGTITSCAYRPPVGPFIIRRRPKQNRCKRLNMLIGTHKSLEKKS